MKLLKNKRIISVICLVLVLGTVLIVPFSANAWNVGYGEANPYKAYLSELRISAYNPQNILVPTALLNSFTVQYSSWDTEEDNGLIAQSVRRRYSNSTSRTQVTLGVLNYGFSSEESKSINKSIYTRYYNDYNKIKEYIAYNFALVPNDRDHLAEIAIFYDNEMSKTPWYNDNPSLPQPIDNFDDDGYLCGFISIKGFFTLRFTGDSASTVGTALYERNHEPSLKYSNAIIGAGTIDLIAEESSTEHIYDIVIAIPINQSGLTDIKNEYDGYFFDIYGSKYGTFYELYNSGYLTGFNESTETHFVDDLLGNSFRGLTNAIDSIMLIDQGGISISLWDIFVTVVVILVFIAFLKIYLGG